MGVVLSQMTVFSGLLIRGGWLLPGVSWNSSMLFVILQQTSPSLFIQSLSRFPTELVELCKNSSGPGETDTHVAYMPFHWPKQVKRPAQTTEVQIETPLVNGRSWKVTIWRGLGIGRGIICGHFCIMPLMLLYDKQTIYWILRMWIECQDLWW